MNAWTGTNRYVPCAECGQGIEGHRNTNRRFCSATRRVRAWRKTHLRADTRPPMFDACGKIRQLPGQIELPLR